MLALIRFCSFGERAVPAEQPFKVMKRRRQQNCCRRLRLDVNHALFGRRLSLSAVDGRCAGAGNNEQCDPKNHHAAVAGLRRLGISRLRRICRCFNRLVDESHLLIIAVTVFVSFSSFIIKMHDISPNGNSISLLFSRRKSGFGSSRRRPFCPKVCS